MSFLGRKPSNAPLTTADIPDGIIVAADLAPNSVDSSELVDGSIDISHFSASGTKDTTTYLRGDNSFQTAGLSSVGHIIQQSSIQRNSTRTTTASTSHSAGYELFSLTISDLLVANTRIRIGINAMLSHANAYGGFISISRTIEGGTQVNDVFENQSDGQGVVYFRDGAQIYGQHYYFYNDEEDLTNSVGDSVVYRINIGTQNASYPTYINRGDYSGSWVDAGNAGSNGTIWEVSK